MPAYNGINCLLCIYYHRPIYKDVDDIIKCYDIMSHPNTIIDGDFNLPKIDWKTRTLKSSKDFGMHTSFVETNNLQQPIVILTHSTDNTLYLVIHSTEITIISPEPSCSDHIIIELTY